MAKTARPNKTIGIAAPINMANAVEKNLWRLKDKLHTLLFYYRFRLLPLFRQRKLNEL